MDEILIARTHDLFPGVNLCDLTSRELDDLYLESLDPELFEATGLTGSLELDAEGYPERQLAVA